MNKLAAAFALLALSTGASFAGNQNPDRDSTREFTTGVKKSKMTLDPTHTASLPQTVLATEEGRSQSGKVIRGRAPWAGR